jgi:hypothetical protein
VAIVPAPVAIMSDSGIIKKIKLHDVTFTAFVGHGFEEQRAQSVMNDQYEYVFMPVTSEAYTQGLRFLFSLEGKRYNYLDLPLTMLPTRLKRTQNITSTSGGCVPARVFCSQAGLMLCYECNVLTGARDKHIDPACCSPGELRSIVETQGGGVACSRAQLEIDHTLLCAS